MNAEKIQNASTSEKIITTRAGRLATDPESVKGDFAAGTETTTPDASNRLTELEKIIEAGRQAFVEVGTALAEIRDSRLYKTNFPTFEEYCIQKWGFKRAHAHRLIEAASIAVKLSPMGDIPSERVARELAKVSIKDRETVIKS